MVLRFLCNYSHYDRRWWPAPMRETRTRHHPGHIVRVRSLQQTALHEQGNIEIRSPTSLYFSDTTGHNQTTEARNQREERVGISIWKQQLTTHGREELGQPKQSPGMARPEKPATHEAKVTTLEEPERVESNRPNFSETLISSVSRLKLTTANSRSDGAPRAAQIQLGKSIILELTIADLRGPVEATKVQP